MKRSVPVLLLTSIIALSAGAFAQEQDEALATELFNAGRDLMADGNYTQACPKLAESARLSTAVGTLGKLAECEERIGKLLSARTHWQQALNLARAQGDERVALVEQQVARLDAVVPKVRIVAPLTRPAGLQVVFDGTPLSVGSLGVAFPVDPGPHEVEATAPRRSPVRLSVSVSADGAITVVSLPELADDQPAVVPATTLPPPAPESNTTVSDDRANSLGTVGLVVAGVGAVGVGVGAYFGGLAKSRLESSNDMGCNGNVCPPDAAAKRDDAREAGTTSTVFFLAGGALVAGGLGLLLFGPDEKNESAPTLSAGASPDGAGLLMRGAW